MIFFPFSANPLKVIIFFPWNLLILPKSNTFPMINAALAGAGAMLVAERPLLTDLNLVTLIYPDLTGTATETLRGEVTGSDRPRA